MRTDEGTPPRPPDTAIASLLPPDVDLDTGWRGRPEATTVWCGVVWGRLGRGDLAWRCLDEVADPALRAWILAEKGRIVRELGLHHAAEAFELPALHTADDPVDVAMLAISTAADAVGRGEAALAVRRLERARDAVDAAPDGPRTARQRLRLGWVAAEVAFLTGRPVPRPTSPRWDDARGEAAYGDDLRWGSAFHRAKAALFAGVVRGDTRLLDAAAAEAPPVLAWAVHLARADAGLAGSVAAAREAWSRIVPPPAFADAVAATPTAQRLRGDG